MNGALPPSSRLKRLMCSALWRISSRPTAVEPVKEILRTVGLPVSSSPMPAGIPVTTLNTPAGMPTRSASTARAKADSGVRSEGLTMTGHPAARAGAHLRVIIALGKFHGVIAAQTPTGCLSVSKRRSPLGAGMVSP
ncbi:hypothetical protein D3C75_798800 [compost metagenome]